MNKIGWRTCWMVVCAGIALLGVACGPAGEPSSRLEDAPATIVAGAAVTTTARPSLTQPVWIAPEPRLVQPGQPLTLSGQGFEAVEVVDAVLVDEIGNTVAGPVSVPVDVRGRLLVELILPEGLAPGDYVAEARGQTSLREAKVLVWIRADAPTLELSTEAVRPEQGMSVNITGFAPRERVVIYVEGHEADPLTAQDADARGNVSAENIKLPILPPGDVQILATGADSLGQARHALQVLAFEPVVALNATVLPAGEAVNFYGSGFAARDNVQVMLEGSNEPPIRLTTDDNGRLAVLEAFQLPASLNGAQVFALSTQLTGNQIRVSFQVTSPHPWVALSSYFVHPGDEITLSLRNLRPRERVDVYLGEGGQRKKLATFRADDQGWLLADSRFQLPPDTPLGGVTIALDGETSRLPMRIKVFVN